jgi:hypothetical protein
MTYPFLENLLRIYASWLIPLVVNTKSVWDTIGIDVRSSEFRNYGGTPILRDPVDAMLIAHFLALSVPRGKTN